MVCGYMELVDWKEFQAAKWSLCSAPIKFQEMRRSILSSHCTMLPLSQGYRQNSVVTIQSAPSYKIKEHNTTIQRHWKPSHRISGDSAATHKSQCCLWTTSLHYTRMEDTSQHAEVPLWCCRTRPPHHNKITPRNGQLPLLQQSPPWLGSQEARV